MLQLKIPRVDLLNWTYPIFIPTANALLSTFGNGEIHHPRSKVSRVKMGMDGKFNWNAMGIQNGSDNIKFGWNDNETPEYFITKKPSIFDFHGKQTNVVDNATKEKEIKELIVEAPNPIAMDGTFKVLN